MRVRTAVRWWFLGGLLSLAIGGVRAADAPSPPVSEPPNARAIILANASDSESLRIARHYAEARQVPEQNIVALPMPAGEMITWREFIATIWEPLRTELVSRRWLDAIPITVNDSLGRKQYAMNGHRIAALVVCRGVPLKIAHEPEFYAENAALTHLQEYRTNAGAVDAELALLAMSNYNINAYVSNPLFRNDAPTALERAQVIPVGRLDGPTIEDVLGLVDRALEVERTGLIGRAYIDLGGPIRDGDQWLEMVATEIGVLGFDATVERTRATLSASSRCDTPAIYFGWYAGDLNGPFALPGFRFPAGTVALHIHSFSAGTLRSTTSGWTGPLVGRGVTATAGNVFEPYLNLTHHPELLLRALSRGATFGEAGLYALPVLSWQAVLVGDPLYRPFAVSLDEQWKNRARLSPKAVGYVAIRRMNLLERAHRDAEALELGQTTQRETPSLALAFAVAQRLQKMNDPAGAAGVLDYAAALKTFSPDEWGLARETAEQLVATGHAANAVAIYRVLLATKTIPLEFRALLLVGAAKAALAMHDTAQSAAWEKEAAESSAAKK